MNKVVAGLIFILVGAALVLYVFNKKEKDKMPWDLKGYAGGFGAIIFGIYLIIQAIIIYK